MLRSKSRGQVCDQEIREEETKPKERWPEEDVHRNSSKEEMATTPAFSPGESHGQSSLEGYSAWGRKELDTTEGTEHTHTTLNKRGHRLQIKPQN